MNFYTMYTLPVHLSCYLPTPNKPTLAPEFWPICKTVFMCLRVKEKYEFTRGGQITSSTTLKAKGWPENMEQTSTIK